MVAESSASDFAALLEANGASVISSLFIGVELTSTDTAPSNRRFDPNATMSPTDRATDRHFRLLLELTCAGTVRRKFSRSRRVVSTEPSQLKPETLFRNVLSIYSPMAMLAGMQLDVFTPLKDGAMTAAELARALGFQQRSWKFFSTHWSVLSRSQSTRGALRMPLRPMCSCADLWANLL
jgi:hypothetical protein